ncbi:MAG: hypothetical protein B0D92_01360 [Spirochaeta sp. LUC14_002_19_P3]|nr:MAG: hypothetical protein B0D92_01360 [Spirochaeta sp. LUC14_002_19_P3]
MKARTTEVDKISVDTLKPFSQTEDSLWLDAKYLLLTKGVPAPESLISNLKKWGFMEVLTKGRIVEPDASATEISDGDEIIEDEDEEEFQNARAFYQELALFTRKVYEMFSRKRQLDLQAVMERVKALIGIIKTEKGPMLQIAKLNCSEVDYLINHTIKTTIIALIIGEELNFSQFRLVELGTAGLFHKIGMMKLPFDICSKIYNKKSELTDIEKKLFTTHPALGMNLLNDYFKEAKLPVIPDIIRGVGEHQERENGSGYPRGLKKGQISETGKILAVASVFNAKISARPYRAGMNGHLAMLEMIREMGGLYDAKVIRALLFAFSLYPPGTYVQLENGTIGVVVNVNENAPKNPIVKLILDENMNVYQQSMRLDTKDTQIDIKGILSDQRLKDLRAQKLIPMK